MSLRFLEVELIVIAHANLIRRYGGRMGVRGHNLLDSAIAQPKVTMDGKFLHKSIFEKASAYGFHLCKNHPFVDGNKRVAFIAMYIFLRKNGWMITTKEEEVYSIMLKLADGKLSKSGLTSWLKSHSQKL